MSTPDYYRGLEHTVEDRTYLVETWDNLQHWCVALHTDEYSRAVHRFDYYEEHEIPARVLVRVETTTHRLLLRTDIGLTTDA